MSLQVREYGTAIVGLRCCSAAPCARHLFTVCPMSDSTVLPDADPERLSASSWSARHAALKSRNVSDDDPRVVEAQAALSYHRLVRVVRSEQAAGHMSAWFAEVITEKLREQAAGVSS